MAVVMIGIVILAGIALCAMSVYLDASGNEIGDISSHRKYYDKSPAYWALATLLLWPFAFPYYLRMRGKLIQAAAENPVREDRRSWKAFGVTLAALAFVVVSIAFPGLPEEIRPKSCSSRETQITVSGSHERDEPKVLPEATVARANDAELGNAQCEIVADGS